MSPAEPETVSLVDGAGGTALLHYHCILSDKRSKCFND
jgi:hypothetical protein